VSWSLRVGLKSIEGALKDYLKWPETEDEWEEIKDGFRSLSKGLENICGSIDGSLISINRPPLDIQFAREFYCRKGFPALNITVIASFDKTFLYMYANSPGSKNDLFVLRHSSLKLNLQDGTMMLPDLGFLLGDQIYPNLGILRPVLENVERELQAENTKLKLARQIVERAFALLKCRWRVLNNKDGEIKLEICDIPLLVTVCILLHNWTIKMGYIDYTYETQEMADFVNDCEHET